MQVVYGDGDGIISKPLTGSRSVIGHKLSQGVVHFSGGLVYRDQSGALNESFSDVFGCLTVQYKKNTLRAKPIDWWATTFSDPTSTATLRSMKAPGTAYNDDFLARTHNPFIRTTTS